MAISIILSVQSMARKLAAAIHESPASSSSSDEVLSSMKKDLESMERTLRRIQAVLNDAEEREIRDASVKLWLKELRWVAHDAENVLGEYQYETRQAEIITSVSAAETSLKRKRQDDQVYEFTSVLLQLSIPQRIRDITERFEEISKARKDLQLTEEDGTRRHSISHVPQPSSSVVHEYGIFGRERDKEAVIQMLLSDEGSSKISVISIVGMGGLGKTTLAQCVYNDPRICQYFDSRGWVCVSEDFDIKRLTEEMIQSIARQPCGLTQLDALQATLKEIVDGKNLLVVLDDVWNEKRSFWESLKVPFLSSITVRILVTTRNESVAKMMQTANKMDMYRLGCLPEGICWSLFCHHAFTGRNPKEHPCLVEVGRKIVQKCGRLPLAIKTLGSLLLHYETDEERWREVLESEIWELDGAKDDILPALKLSYYRMPTHLKPCFLFISLYPKDFKFEKDKLIKMWMAQGYILSQGNKRLEDTGNDYFDELQRRSFILHGISEEYVLHDIVHDLARHISKNEHHSIVLESNGKVCHIPAKVRHLFVRHQQGTNFGQVSLENARDLRTLIVDGDYPLDEVDLQLEHLNHLRVLEMKHGSCSFGNLKHLCYLDCKYSDGNYSSSFLSYLYNMQTLFLSLSSDFQHLASSIRHLANLRHIYLQTYESRSIRPPWPTTRGTCYSTFSKLMEITLGGNTEWVSSVPLGQLPSVRYLRIRNMPCGIMLVGKFLCLEELRFEYMSLWKEWSGVMDGDFPCLRELTLEYCPLLRVIPMLPSSLRSLHIFKYYNLKSLPVNDGQVRFPCMKELVFQDMPDWEEWPGLNSGDFPRLCKLTITHCNKLRRFPLLPSSLDKNHGQVGFPCLEEMLIDDIPELQEEWYGVSDGYFPCLRKLTINRCQKLQGFPTLSSSLKFLSIKSCWSLTSLAGLQNLTSLERLELERCPNLHIFPQEGLSSKPQHVKIVDCLGLQEWCNMHQFDCIQNSYGLAELTINDVQMIIKDLGVDNLTSLKRLELCVREDHLPSDGWLPHMIQILKVCSCHWLMSLPLHQNLLLLTRLEILSCPVLSSVDGLHNLPNLEVLSLESCPKLQLLPDNSLPSSLQTLSVKGCKELRSLPLLHEKLSSLEMLIVFNCPELTIMVGLHNLSSLKTLIISQCPVLRLSSDEQLSSMPHYVSIADCPTLEEWCQQQSIPYSQLHTAGS